MSDRAKTPDWVLDATLDAVEAGDSLLATPIHPPPVSRELEVRFRASSAFLWCESMEVHDGMGGSMALGETSLDRAASRSKLVALEADGYTFWVPSTRPVTTSCTRCAPVFRRIAASHVPHSERAVSCVSTSRFWPELTQAWSVGEDAIDVRCPDCRRRATRVGDSVYVANFTPDPGEVVR